MKRQPEGESTVATTRPSFLARITRWHRLKRWQRVLITIAALTAGSVALYFYNYPIISFNQKITLEVDYKGQTYTASNVTRVTAWYQPTFGFPHARGGILLLESEAIHLELPGGRHLFGLLCMRNGGLAWAAFRAFPEYKKKPYWPRDIKSAEGERQLPAASLPVLIEFEDIHDWRTVRVLNAAKDGSLSPAENDIEAIRGTIQITEEPVSTSHLADVLPWWRYAEGNPYEFRHGVCGKNLSAPQNAVLRSVAIKDFRKEGER